MAKQLHSKEAKVLAHTHKSKPFWEEKTPKHLLKILEKVGIKTNIYRINKVNSIITVDSDLIEGNEIDIDNACYDDYPSAVKLRPLQTILQLPFETLNLLNDPYNQLDIQFELVIEKLLEEKEDHIVKNLVEICNQRNLIHQKTNMYPTPNNLDIMTEYVWKHPDFYLMHPKCITKFCQECTARGVCIGTIEMNGRPVLTWRDIPIIISDKIPIEQNGDTYVLLIRMEESENGVFEIYNKHENTNHNNINEDLLKKFNDNGVFIQTRQVNKSGMESYVFSLFYNIVVPVNDAITCLKCNLNKPSNMIISRELEQFAIKKE
jgi:hypothetical protein